MFFAIHLVQVIRSHSEGNLALQCPVYNLIKAKKTPISDYATLRTSACVSMMFVLNISFVNVILA